MNVLRGARVVVASLVGTAAGLTAGAARAERPGIGVRYSAPSGCPTEVEFLDNVRQRNPRVLTASALDPPQFLVTVTEGVSPRFSGRLERVTQTGAMGVREISGESCREVSAALALITALTADLTSAVSSTDGDRAGVGAAGRTDDLTTSSVTLRDKDAPAKEPPVDRPSPAEKEPGTPNVRWQVGLEGLLASGVTPNPLPGGTLFGEVGGRSSAFWVPSLRLSASLGGSSWSSSLPTSSAHAQFLWWVASLDVCPLQLGDPLALSIQPCARVTAGLLRASGMGRTTTHTESAFWSDLGALVRVHGQLARALFVDGDAELFVPRVSYQFDFTKPNETAEVAGTIGFRLEAGVGVVFR
jgi:hypothetical protein